MYLFQELCCVSGVGEIIYYFIVVSGWVQYIYRPERTSANQPGPKFKQYLITSNDDLNLIPTRPINIPPPT